MVIKLGNNDIFLGVVKDENTRACMFCCHLLDLLFKGNADLISHFKFKLSSSLTFTTGNCLCDQRLPKLGIITGKKKGLTSLFELVLEGLEKDLKEGLVKIALRAFKKNKIRFLQESFNQGRCLASHIIHMGRPVIYKLDALVEFP